MPVVGPYRGTGEDREKDPPHSSSMLTQTEETGFLEMSRWPCHSIARPLSMASQGSQSSPSARHPHHCLRLCEASASSSVERRLV